MTFDLSAIKARAAAATPGPWGWFGYVPAPKGYAKQRNVYLATQHSGRIYVMDFERWGINGARPRFQDHEQHLMIDEPARCFQVAEHSGAIEGVTHPDAAFIAHARADVDALIAEVERKNEVGERIRRQTSWWLHGEDCPRNGHDECDTQIGGDRCEQGDPVEECAERECDCTVEAMAQLVDELIGDAADREAAAARVGREKLMREALEKIAGSLPDPTDASAWADNDSEQALRAIAFLARRGLGEGGAQ
jgi:hypothetical protein